MNGPNPTQLELGQTSAQNRVGPISAQQKGWADLGPQGGLVDLGPTKGWADLDPQGGWADLGPTKLLFRLGQTRSGPKHIVTKLGRKPGPVQGSNGEGNYFPFP